MKIAKKRQKKKKQNSFTKKGEKICEINHNVTNRTRIRNNCVLDRFEFKQIKKTMPDKNKTKQKNESKNKNKQQQKEQEK